MLAAALAAPVFHGGLRFVPLPAALLSQNIPGLEFTDRNGLPLRQCLAGNPGFSQRAALPGIPQALIEATLAAEDKRFKAHGGLDCLASARAAWQWLRHGEIRSGGSTLTQQLIKISQPRPRTLRTKLLEALQAMRLEQIWDKQQILEEYLNRVGYGNLCVGCASAARYYFGKPLPDLSTAECAFLAGLPQAPARLNPHLHFERARQRQQRILERMRQNGMLNEADCARAKTEPLRLRPPVRCFEAPHAVDLLLAGRQDLSGAAPGRSIRTTIDLPLNRLVEQMLRARVQRLQSQHVQNGAAVVLDNLTGEVLALVGSENYFAPAAGQVNGVWAARSAGSTLKPFTYALAFEHGATPATLVADVPCEFATATGVFRPVNYNHHFFGPMRYRLALANSLNVSAVKILHSLGGPAVLRQRLQQCGLTTLTRPAEDYGLGLTIGNAEVRLIELTNAYACLARLGRWKPYQLVANDAAHPEEQSGGLEFRLFDKSVCYLLADILADNAARTPAFGALSALRFDFPVACKTGTSSNFRDNWALGFTPEFTVGVWIGNFDGTPMEQISGVTGAAPVLHDIFSRLHATRQITWYAQPADVTELAIHPITGKLLPTAAKHGVLEKFQAAVLPPEQAVTDYDRTGRVHLDFEYHDWLASGDNWLADQAVITSVVEQEPLRIVSPLPGTVFYLDPDLPAKGEWVRLKSNPSDRLIWESGTLPIVQIGGEPFAKLAEGRHRLKLLRTATRETIETWIEVRSL